MALRTVGTLLSAVLLMRAVIIDQIAVVVGNSIVKDSDISRDIRVTEFLNRQPLDLSEKVRKETASRLIDQIFIRKEIELGNYPVATQQEADHELNEIVRQEFKSEAALQDRLRRYGITAPDLRSHFLWQLTVLRFVDLRFRPAVLITNNEIESYYKQHALELRRKHPSKSSLADLRDDISDTLTAERVNKLFFSWLDEQRKQTKITYFERSLQ